MLEQATGITALVLKEPVFVYGRDYFGRKAKVVFWPVEGSGWWWKHGGKYFPQPVDIRLVPAGNSSRRVVLHSGSHRLNIWEHIGALAAAGITGVAVQSSSAWPPYHGRTLELLEALLPHCQPDGHIPWLQTKLAKPIRVQDPKNPRRFLEFCPLSADEPPSLQIKVIIDYRGLGHWEQDFTVPGADLRTIFQAHTQGIPPRWLLGGYFLSRFAGWLSGGRWQHHSQIWPQEHSKDEALSLFCQHRLADLLGDLSLLHHRGLLAGRIISCCAGHSIDTSLVRCLREFPLTWLTPPRRP